MTNDGTELRLENIVASHGVGRHKTPVLHGITLEAQAGELLSILGPSGCGKTTLLRVIAGLHTADKGWISLGGQEVLSGSRSLPPEHRRVGLVPQDSALFPHRTVAENIEFGLRSRVSGRRRLSRAERSQRIGRMLAVAELEGLERRYPHELSGGQRQRVALARALAPEPRLILLDEAFGALDASLRSQVRSEVRRILRAADTTAILVTHDQDEALSMSDRVAIMHNGRILQLADPRTVYLRPATTWVAQFLGECNVLDGVSDGQIVTCPLGELDMESSPGAVDVLLRPEQITLTVQPQGPARHGLPARVVECEYLGHSTVYSVLLEGSGQALRVRHGGQPRCAIGALAHVTWDDTVQIVPKESPTVAAELVAPTPKG